MKILFTIACSLLVILVIGFLSILIYKAYLSHQQTPELGIVDGNLLPCPSSPNCVSSDTSVEDTHYIEPFSASQWHQIKTLLVDNSNVEIITSNTDYIHATFTTSIFRFIDDIEFHLRTGENIIAVRSASRQGYSDLNANMLRVNKIREQLESQ